MATTDGTAAEPALTPPSYLQYNRSSNLLGAGIALVVGGQTCLIAGVFAAVSHVPWATISNDYDTSGLAITLLVLGILVSLIGLVVLGVGFLNLGGNIDLLAWSASKQLPTAPEPADLWGDD